MRPARGDAPKDLSKTEKTTLRDEARRRARQTVLYWAARQRVPIFSPSLADGDLIEYLLDASDETHPDPNPDRACSSFSSSSSSSRPLAIDLVRDLCRINRMGMFSKCTGMILCGGGLVKHHIANANLMRNGADYAVVLSNSQEFDGSDAGARPDEAVSWGKIRIDGSSAKVYSEVTTVFPLLVAQVFLPLVRRQREEREKAGVKARQR
ncbi:unnamed protein product [Phytomonas sp. EM1]|nr:unnamed protein product [Phytomonas sp. EM1]|eukprot:CCW60490.1 unnamed protein product [Phytomonas sp. isolate EM1]